MAAPFITLAKTDANATHAQRILSVVSQIKTLRESIDSLVAESFQMFDGNAELQFVLPAQKYGTFNGNVADAQTIFNLLNGTKLAINGEAQNANAIDLATRIG